MSKYNDYVDKLHPFDPPVGNPDGNSGLPWEGYYYSGYGIAVKRGYTGTEEEWLAHLKGNTGATGAAIVSQVKTGETSDGSYIYTQTFDDGTTQTFTVPRGQKGDPQTWSGLLPSGGIPKTDLASAVQTSLEKADSALQEHQSLAAYRTSAEQDSIHDSTKQDKISVSGILKGTGGGNVGIAGADDIPGFSYTTTAPTGENTDGLKVAVLTSEPTTKYDGWLYIITEA